MFDWLFGRKDKKNVAEDKFPLIHSGRTVDMPLTNLASSIFQSRYYLQGDFDGAIPGEVVVIISTEPGWSANPLDDMFRWAEQLVDELHLELESKRMTPYSLNVYAGFNRNLTKAYATIEAVDNRILPWND